MSKLAVFSDPADLVQALGSKLEQGEADRIHALATLGLPPITSANALAVMWGLNPGFVWSMLNRPNRHYRTFRIPKGKQERNILAPRVGIKQVQKWLSIHLAETYNPPENVFGFVPGRNHIGAAKYHIGCSWAISLDIFRFFESTPRETVIEVLKTMGYDEDSSIIISRLLTYKEMLVQGSPASPLISNVALNGIDEKCINFAKSFDGRYTRYADDFVFSGSGDKPENLIETVRAFFDNTPWTIAAEKIRIQPLHGRIKIHGLLVASDRVRLTKGYRNRIRAYKHVAKQKGAHLKNARKIWGHLNFANQVSLASGEDKVATKQLLDGLRQSPEFRANWKPQFQQTTSIARRSSGLIEQFDRAFESFRKWFGRRGDS